MLSDRAQRVPVSAEEHGGSIPARPAHKYPVVDFSTTVNAWGPPPRVVDAARSAPIDQYPDRDALLPRAAAAELWKCDLNEVAFGAGTCELILAVANAFVGRGDIVVVAAPAFGEYRRAAQIAGATVAEARVFPPGDRADIDRLCAAIRKLRPKLAFLCNPNNPTGHLLSPDEMRAVSESCGSSGSLLVLDRSLQSFAEEAQYPCDDVSSGATIVLRSITKDFSLAGARAGFMHAHPRIVDLVNSVRAPWSGSSQAQAAATAAMHPESMLHMKRTVALSRRAAIDLSREVAAIGFRVAESRTHFFMIKTGNGFQARKWLLDRRRVHVRDCSSFGEAAFLRIAARTPSDNATLLAALRAYGSRANGLVDRNDILNGRQHDG